MAHLAETTVLILAGGLGTRLRPAVADRPKALAEIGGRPFLAYLLDNLVEAGLHDVVVCTGHMGEQIRDCFGLAYGPLQLAYSQETEPCGTAGALRLALPLITSPTSLVLNGDSLSDVNLQQFSTWMACQGAALGIAVIPVANSDAFGCVQTDAQDWVRTFEEKGQRRGAGWVNAGIYLVRRPVLEALPTGRALSLEREVMPQLIGNGLAAYRSNGRFIDIGTPESLALAAAFVAADVPAGI